MLAESDVLHMSSPDSSRKLLKLALLPLSAALVAAAGCGGALMSSNGDNAIQRDGPAFLVGTDAPAPLPSVVGVKIQLESIVLTNGSTKSNNLLVNPVTVDFARYNGLQGLVDMNNVQPGTYTGVTIGLGTANEIDYLNASGAPPTISMLTPTLTTSTVSIMLNNPLTVSATGGVPVGLRMDLDLGQSIRRAAATLRARSIRRLT